MPTMTLTVARIDPPKPNGKKGTIVGTDGQVIYAYPDKTTQFAPGRTYQIEYSTSDWKGKTFNNLESFVQIAAPVTTSAPRAEPFVSGTYRPTETISAPTVTTPSVDERIFVQGMVQNFIRSGEVTLDNVETAVTKMRGVWKRTLGRAAIQQQMEAAE